MFIGEIIKEYRDTYNLSQIEFASKTSLSHSYINTLEKVFNPKTGKPYSVTTDVAKELANAMKMPIEDLIYKLDETQEIEVNSNESNLNNDTPILNDRTHTVRVPIYRYHSCRFTS